ncbi:MAG: sugar transferase [Chthoniobacterales bacterium]|nr:sugar transferase [Chthoniobacterales bacterium]
MSESISTLLRQAVFDCAARDRNDTQGVVGKHTPSDDAQSQEETQCIGADSSATPDEVSDVDSHSIPAWKRLLDLALVVLASPVWLPLMLILMLVVRLSSPGPIFYWQERVGHRGRRFLICKFRTMKIDADTYTHESYFEKLVREGLPMTKLDAAGDPRIIPCGRLLRASGLDELPQIFNIMRGEMSVVGPRPCTVREFEAYLPWQRARVNALPGLTGYWQVNGKNRTTFNQMIDMDIFYAEHPSLGLDLKIISKTFSVLLDQTLEIFRPVPAETPVAAGVPHVPVPHEQGVRV